MRITDHKVFELKASQRYNKMLSAHVAKRAQHFQPDRNDERFFDAVEVSCRKCKHLIAKYKHKRGTDVQFNNWDIEYFYSAKKNEWHGCYTLNIDPKSKISFVCSCGNDSRDIAEGARTMPNIGFEFKILT